MEEPIVIAAIVTAAGSIAAAALGGLFYLWRRDPASARNATLERITVALNGNNSHNQKVIASITAMDQRHSEFHKRLLSALEKMEGRQIAALTDFRQEWRGWQAKAG